MKTPKRIDQRSIQLRMPTQRGFSLLEIVIVISIMAILAGVAVPVASTLFNSNARRATGEELENLGVAIVEYFRDTELLPSDATSLMVDPGVSGWSGPYVILDALEPVRGQPDGELDAWRNPYAFNSAGTSSLQVSSAGIDGAQGTSDDLTLVVDVTPVRREVSLDELKTINQAILQYNADYLPSSPLSTNYTNLLSTLVATGYLPSATAYETDGWGDAYAADPPGVSPVVRVASANVAGFGGGGGSGSAGNGNSGGNGNGNGGGNGNGNSGGNGNGNSGGNGNGNGNG